MPNKTKNILAILFLAIVSFTIFWFYHNKLLVTPDFGESDAYHYNLSAKYYLSTSLKHNSLPFWTDQLQGGYPFIAESQSGAFYILDLVLLRFLPFVTAYNLLFAVSFFFLACGMYLVLREYNIYPLLSLLLSLVFLFNGSYMFRLTHLNLILSFSLFPFLFYIYLRLLKKPGVLPLVLFPFTISQMIYAGHNQVVFVSLFGLLTYHFLSKWLVSKSLKTTIISSMKLVLLIGIGYLLASPQILPTATLSKNSVRSLSLDYATATSFPFSMKEIVNYLFPYAYGDPQVGSYPVYSDSTGIFWENTPYIGFAVVVMAYTLALASLFIKKKANKLLIVAGLVFGVCFILALGKNSPFYFIFNFPPFNFYRTPSKFLIPSVFFLLIFIAFIFQLWTSYKKIVKWILIIILFANITTQIIVVGQYHFFADAQKVLSIPETASHMSSSPYLTIDANGYWNTIFLKKGWSDKESQNGYMYLKNELYPDSNLLFNKSSYSINSPGFQLKRVSFISSYILGLIGKEKSKLTVPYSAVNLMKLIGISNIVSSDKINSSEFLKTYQTGSKTPLYVYQLQKDTESLYYLPKHVTEIKFVKDFTDLADKSNNFVQDAVLEQPVPLLSGTAKVTIRKKTVDRYDLSVKSTGNTMLVLRKNYYPEWRMLIDDKPAKMYRVNLIHVGVIVPKGSHSVSYIFTNNSFKTGLALSSVVGGIYILTLCIFLKRLKRWTL